MSKPSTGFTFAAAALASVILELLVAIIMMKIERLKYNILMVDFLRNPVTAVIIVGLLLQIYFSHCYAITWGITR